MNMTGFYILVAELKWGWRVVALIIALALACELWRKFRARSTHKATWIKTRYFLGYPLPPRPYWLQTAGGPVSVCDAIVLTIYTALALLNVYARVIVDEGPDESYQKRLKAYAKAFGAATRSQLMLSLLPIPRSNFLASIIPEAEFSVMVKYHRWLSWGLLFTYTLHGAAYAYVWMGANHLLEEALFKNAVNLFGCITLLVGFIISATSCSFVRRSNYQLFYVTHIICAPLFFLALVIHDRITTFFIAPSILLYVLDRVHRAWMDLNNRTCVSAAQGSLQMEGNSIITIKLPWKKETGMRGTETLYLTAPTISASTTHPFSVADVTEAPSGTHQISTVHAKVSGKWTAALRHHVLTKPHVPLPLKVEGPYESSLRTLPDSSVIVMVAGGVGITPLLSLLRRYNREHRAAAAAAADAPDPTTPQQLPAPQTHAPEKTAEQPNQTKKADWRGWASQDRAPRDQQQAHNASLPTAEHTVDTQSGHESTNNAMQHACGEGCQSARITGARGASGAGLGSAQHTPSQQQGNSTDNGASSSSSSGSSSSRNSSSGWGSKDTDVPSCAVPIASVHEGEQHTGAPPRVYLVFACKTLDELQLLGPELLDAAYGPGHSWLHLYVSYTGFELEASEEKCPHCITSDTCLLRPPLLSNPAAAQGSGYHSKLPPNVVPPCKLAAQNGELGMQNGGGENAAHSVEGSACSACGKAVGGGKPCGACRWGSCCGSSPVAGCGGSVGMGSKDVCKGSCVIDLAPSGAKGGVSSCQQGQQHGQQGEGAGSGSGAHVQQEASQRLHSPISRRPVLYTLCAVLALAGTNWAAMGYGFGLLESSAKTKDPWKTPIVTGLILFAAMMLGPAVPPALVLGLRHVFIWAKTLLARLFFGKKQDHDCTPLLLDTTAGDTEQGIAPSASLISRELRVLPNYLLDWDTRPSGMRVKICRGRPQLFQLLWAIQKEHSAGDKHIPVLIGGPETMWAQSAQSCWDLNRAAGSEAFLEPHRVAHTH